LQFLRPKLAYLPKLSQTTTEKSDYTLAIMHANTSFLTISPPKMQDQSSAINRPPRTSHQRRTIKNAPLAAIKHTNGALGFNGRKERHNTIFNV